MPRRGEYAVLRFAAPGGPVHNIGVLLVDLSTGRLHFRLMHNWATFPPASRSVLAGLAKSIEAMASDMGGDQFLGWLEETASNAIQVTGREAIEVESFTHALDGLYQRHVEKLVIMPFRTHLPLYSLRAAAGRFGGEQVVGEEDWVRTPEGLRLTERMFVAHVVGRSMEPRIPDGSLNILRAPVVGSRQNKIVLVELLAEQDEAARYTIKRYTSRKVRTGEDEWAHQSITLHPLNPEFQAFDLRDGEFRVIAEWLQVLE